MPISKTVRILCFSLGICRLGYLAPDVVAASSAPISTRWPWAAAFHRNRISRRPWLDSIRRRSLSRLPCRRICPSIIDRSLGDPMLASQVGHLRPSLMLFQHCDSLLFREPGSLHLSVLLQGRTLTPSGGNT